MKKRHIYLFQSLFVIKSSKYCSQPAPLSLLKMALRVSVGFYCFPNHFSFVRLFRYICTLFWVIDIWVFLVWISRHFLNLYTVLFRTTTWCYRKLHLIIWIFLMCCVFQCIFSILLLMLEITKKTKSLIMNCWQKEPPPLYYPSDLS